MQFIALDKQVLNSEVACTFASGLQRFLVRQLLELGVCLRGNDKAVSQPLELTPCFFHRCTVSSRFFVRLQ